MKFVVFPLSGVSVSISKFFLAFNWKSFFIVATKSRAIRVCYKYLAMWKTVFEVTDALASIWSCNDSLSVSFPLLKITFVSPPILKLAFAVTISI